MAANQSIKELMAAESKASLIISEARQGTFPTFVSLWWLMRGMCTVERGDRLKQAKVEAEKEISTYREQQENSFRLSNTEVCLLPPD
jgi:V-type H+-transporting ATPase subunit G